MFKMGEVGILISLMSGCTLAFFPIPFRYHSTLYTIHYVLPNKCDIWGIGEEWGLYWKRGQFGVLVDVDSIHC